MLPGGHRLNHRHDEKVKTLLSIIFALVCPLMADPLQVTRWDAAKVNRAKVAEIDGIIDRIMANKGRYDEVDRKVGVPWYAISSIHNMEADGSFRCSLYEGSPLTVRSRFEPKGRPTWGSPPFRWEDVAVDALKYDKLDKVAWAKLNDTLYAIEVYNGTGVLKYHPDVPTPYLWSGTSIYIRGKYVADGKWSSTAISGQVGVAAIFKRMEERGILNFSKLQR